MKEKVELDAEKFAYAVMRVSWFEDESDDLKYSKAALKRYLTAYYLAERFNQLESEHFDGHGDKLLHMLGELEPIDLHSL